MTSPPRREGGSPNGDIKLKGYSIKEVTRGRGVKNLKMEVTSFMNAPLESGILARD